MAIGWMNSTNASSDAGSDGGAAFVGTLGFAGVGLATTGAAGLEDAGATEGFGGSTDTAASVVFAEAAGSSAGATGGEGAGSLPAGTSLRATGAPGGSLWTRAVGVPIVSAFGVAAELRAAFGIDGGI